MPKLILSDSEIAGYAKAAGFSGNSLVTAVAIALAESGGNTYAHNPKYPDDSYGLWQINMVGEVGSARRQKFGLRSNEDLYHPATNARVAYAISNQGQNFRPWATYTSGKYLGFLPRAKKAAQNPSTSLAFSENSGTSQVGLIEGLQEIGDFFEFITDPATWIRLGMILGGGVLLIFAIAGMSGQTERVVKMADAITDVLPQTRTLKAAAKAGKI